MAAICRSFHFYHDSSGSSQRTAVYCHTTKAAMRSAKGPTNSRETAALKIPTGSSPMDLETRKQAGRAQRPETKAKTALGSLHQRKGAPLKGSPPFPRA